MIHHHLLFYHYHAQFQKKCLGKMGDVAHEGRTVLFVSHNHNMADLLDPVLGM